MSDQPREKRYHMTLRPERKERSAIPDEVFKDRERRNNTPRTLTQSLFNDPPPGYSALDRRTK